jgi:ABC-type nitrate/sulfonate/bicarbonate transport system ATPase subunit
VDEALYLAERIIVLSAKPARVVETVPVSASRPRAIESDPELRKQRRDLLELFAKIEKANVEETI